MYHAVCYSHTENDDEVACLRRDARLRVADPLLVYAEEAFFLFAFAGTEIAPYCATE